MIEELWKVIFFKNKKPDDKRAIFSDNWTDFNDFLTNGRDGVFIAFVDESSVESVQKGNLVVIDSELAPVKGDLVIQNGEITEYHGGATSGVILGVLKMCDSHWRQRE